MEVFGINYDPKSITTHKNRRGNGFIEKIVTKALNNVRADLRAVVGRATTSLREESTKDCDNEESTFTLPSFLPKYL
jgi:hypothetical protein